MPQTPQCLEQVGHHIGIRDASNRFGEVSAATLTVTGLTMPLVFSKQLFQESGNHPYFYGGTAYDEYEDAYGSRIQLIFDAKNVSHRHLPVCAWHHQAQITSWVLTRVHIWRKSNLLLFRLLTKDRGYFNSTLRISFLDQVAGYGTE
jgi:hypothetical protein